MGSNNQDSPSPSQSTSRRNFLHTTSALAASGALTGAMGIARAAHPGGSDEIKIGLVGAGGRGTSAAAQAMNTEGPTKLVAVCDAFEHRLKACMKQLSSYGDKVDVPKERQHVGFDAYKKVLESDCDLVILATPPGFRPLHFEAAVAAGKHIFMEKPVAVDATGVRRVLEANKSAVEKNLAVAVGLQRRHEQAYIDTVKRIREDNQIGDIVSARAYWNGGGVWVRPRKPEQSEMAYQMENWYYFNWLCGDHITEQHIHNLDVINWIKDSYPVSAQGMGGREVRTGIDHGQIFDHHFVEFTYADDSKLFSQCRHIPNCWSKVGETVQGTNGRADVGAGEIYDASGKSAWKYGRGGRGGHQQEHHDLFASLRAGKIPNEAEYGAMSTMTSILGRMATYSGKMIQMKDALASELVVSPVDEFHSFDDTPPVVPDSNGRYPLPVPGKTAVV
ncbi:Gfo/Idh/MocA family protein [Adhaeretor mobilis]|uniref:Inositol 2-dehydrogenase n=1 Tax=Adhaeretor mobilis TaxID=1930276 RepID=A0A517MU55_9BACT|nr:Gfo/Idh/MocA family oxidoreductase [Adhaeretor mobilis]QDS98411.1 Inositol 2-dehydrogenase [Adhaeretor mobilis]